MMISKYIWELFKKYEVEWFVNIYTSTGKTLEYSPLHDELSYDGSESVTTSITLIKNHKKSTFSLDGFDIQKLENAFEDMLSTIEFAQYDKDIVLPAITDSIEKDFSNPALTDISFDDLKWQFEIINNFSFWKDIFLEAFSIWVSQSTQVYINSLWSVKQQVSNSYFYYIEIYGEKNGIKESHYDYFSAKEFQSITPELLDKLQKELDQKLSPTSEKLAPGKYDITLDRDVVINFLEVILWNLSAEYIREGMSLFSKNTLWEKVFWDNFTLINDPNLNWYTGNIVFDKEWVTAKKVELFKGWVLFHKFYDYKNALKEWLEYLGNSWVSNIEMIGEENPNFLKWSKVLFTNLMAFHTVDEITGKFALLWEWYLLEDGKKQQYIKNISLSGNIIDLFCSIKCLWDDFKVGGNFKVPSVSFYHQSVV